MENLKNIKMPPGGGRAAGGLGGVLAAAGLGIYTLSNCLFNVEGGHRAIVFNRVVGIKENVSSSSLSLSLSLSLSVSLSLLFLSLLSFETKRKLLSTLLKYASVSSSSSAAISFSLFGFSIPIFLEILFFPPLFFFFFFFLSSGLRGRDPPYGALV